MNAVCPPKLVINQLKPFSPERFDACMNHLMRVYSRTLDQHDITKIHVMADFFHVLETGKQMIGGALSPWKHGPVLVEGYNRIRSLGHQYDEVGPTHQGKIRAVGKSGRRYLYDAHGVVDDEDFSAAETEALRRAWGLIMPMTFKQRDDFFHGDGYMGRAWNAARSRESQGGIDWAEVISEYDAEKGEDHTSSRLMIEAWRGNG